MKPRPRNTTAKHADLASGYGVILADVTGLLESARRAAARSVNAVMTATYWEIGRRIVEYEQGGKGKAEYGVQLLERLSADLTSRFGRGFSRPNLHRFRHFYLSYPPDEICSTALNKLAGRVFNQAMSGKLQTPSAKSPTAPISQAESLESQKCSTAPDESAVLQTSSGRYATLSRKLGFEDLARHFPLPWSHYVMLITRTRSLEARAFYEAEALRGGWTVRQLDRQISTQFYERTALSRDKAAMLLKADKASPEDVVTPEEELKDPLFLEFLGLKDEYSETDLEEALILKLEQFLLELGNDFAFVGRQRRLRIGNVWYRIDLLLFHRRLRCPVVVDLKLGPLTAADAGQMHLYLNYARENWTLPDENPPVGLILCAERDAAVARYALEGLPNKVLAAQYKTALPNEELLAAEIERERKLLESRR